MNAMAQPRAKMLLRLSATGFFWAVGACIGACAYTDALDAATAAQRGTRCRSVLCDW